MQPDAFTADERAIEGLPIRLVIAGVVGVASLGIMMNALTALQMPGVTELDVQPEPEVIGDESTDVSLTVVGANGDRVSNATVIAKSGTADLGSVETARTDSNGTVTLSIDPDLGPNQGQGTVELRVKPPAGSQFADKRENTDILVVRDV